MKKEIFKKGPLSVLRSVLFPMLFTFAVIGMISYGLDQTERSSRAEGLRLLEEGILRATVTCYATEGHYPDSISYIEEHYGIRIDRTKYIVHYDMFASNLMPDITVIEINP